MGPFINFLSFGNSNVGKLSNGQPNCARGLAKPSSFTSVFPKAGVDLYNTSSCFNLQPEDQPYIEFTCFYLWEQVMNRSQKDAEKGEISYEPKLASRQHHARVKGEMHLCLLWVAATAFYVLPS